jgi:2-polyprenyl-6-methoxyphenol hydroxylase-like FAD-dependent oxidoreductase
MAPFRVLIAGASVSGLTLAIMLEAYGIDYEMFEKHAEIGPFLDTTIVVNPNGARILDQLGCWEPLSKVCGNSVV